LARLGMTKYILKFRCFFFISKCEKNDFVLGF
jgi:hypothetical protein